MFRRDRPIDAAARMLFLRIVEQARLPTFYRQGGVPDTLDGRFEMVSLHLFLVLRRLRLEETRRQDAEALAQRLFDTAFANMDENLREMGVGDLSVGAKVKRMAQAFYGRVAAYDQGLAADGPTLADALRRNLYGTVTPAPAAVAALADYLRREGDALAGQGFDGLAAGRLAFGPAPEPEIPVVSERAVSERVVSEREGSVAAASRQEWT